MSVVKPQLVIDRDTGKVCMQLRLGSFTATQELPEGIKEWLPQERETFIENLTREMFAGLMDMRRTDQRKLRRKSEANS